MSEIKSIRDNIHPDAYTSTKPQYAFADLLSSVIRHRSDTDALLEAHAAAMRVLESAPESLGDQSMNEMVRSFAQLMRVFVVIEVDRLRGDEE